MSNHIIALLKYEQTHESEITKWCGWEYKYVYKQAIYKGYYIFSRERYRRNDCQWLLCETQFSVDNKNWTEDIIEVVRVIKKYI